MVLLLRTNRPHSDFYPDHQAGCSLGNNLDQESLDHVTATCDDCSIVSCGCASAQTCSSALEHSKPETQPPKLVTLTTHLRVKVLQEAGDNGAMKRASSFALSPLVPVISWFFTSPTAPIFLVPRGLRGTPCCSDIIFPFFGGFEANGRSSG